MPTTAVLKPFDGETITGTVNGLFATNDRDMLSMGIGGAVQVAGHWHNCPPEFTVAMLIVAADAKRAGTPVFLYIHENNMISAITSAPVIYLGAPS